MKIRSKYKKHVVEQTQKYGDRQSRSINECLCKLYNSAGRNTAQYKSRIAI